MFWVDIFYIKVRVHYIDCISINEINQEIYILPDKIRFVFIIGGFVMNSLFD